MAREGMPQRRCTWRQKVRIVDDTNGSHCFYIDFGEYEDGRLGEVFITAKKYGTFARGVLDSLGRAISTALQSGTSPHDMAKQLLEQDYPPQGRVESDGSSVKECSSVANYIGQEIIKTYGEDGRRIPMPEKIAGGFMQGSGV